MTQQVISDIFFNNKLFSVCKCITTKEMFDPKDFGLPTPMSPATCLWDGYYCDYEILNNTFYLKNLYIHFIKEGLTSLNQNIPENYMKGPEFCGIQPIFKHSSEYHIFLNNEYKNLNLQLTNVTIPKLVIGCDIYCNDFYHLWKRGYYDYPAAFKYNEVYACSVENGEVKNIINCSEWAKVVRNFVMCNYAGGDIVSWHYCKEKLLESGQFSDCEYLEDLL